MRFTEGLGNEAGCLTNNKYMFSSGVHTVKKLKFVFIMAVLIMAGLRASAACAQTARWPEPSGLV